MLFEHGDPDALSEFEAFDRHIEQNLTKLESLEPAPTSGRALATLRGRYEDLRTRSRVIMNQLDARFLAVQMLAAVERQPEEGGIPLIVRRIAGPESDGQHDPRKPLSG